MFRSLLLVGIVAWLVHPAPADACSLEDTRPPNGFLRISADSADMPRVVANSAYFLRSFQDGEPTRVLARDLEDGSEIRGVRVFASESALATLYTLEQPLVPGHEYETLDDEPLHFVAIEASAVPPPSAPTVSSIRTGDAGGACSWDCGSSTTLEGADEPAGDVAFHAIRWAENEEELGDSAPISAVAVGRSIDFGTIPGHGVAAVTVFDFTGVESERTIVSIESSDEEGGCRAAPRTSGGQLLLLLGLTTLGRRALRKYQRA